METSSINSNLSTAQIGHEDGTPMHNAFSDVLLVLIWLYTLREKAFFSAPITINTGHALKKFHNICKVLTPIPGIWELMDRHTTLLQLSSTSS